MLLYLGVLCEDGVKKKEMAVNLPSSFRGLNWKAGRFEQPNGRIVRTVCTEYPTLQHYNTAKKVGPRVRQPQAAHRWPNVKTKANSRTELLSRDDTTVLSGQNLAETPLVPTGVWWLSSARRGRIKALHTAIGRCIPFAFTEPGDRVAQQLYLICSL